MSDDRINDELSNEERAKDIDTKEFREYWKKKNRNKDTTTPVAYRETFLKLEDWMEQESIDSWEDMDAEDVGDFYDELSDEQHLRDNACSQHFGRLKQFWKSQDDDYSHLIEAAKELSFSDLTLEEEARKEEVTYLDKHDYADMIEACETTREELILRILWECGLRRAEVAETRVSDVDREKEHIDVITKKTQKPRSTPYSVEMKGVLREWLDYGGRDQYSKAEDSKYLIVTQHSEQVQPAYVNKVVKRVAKRAGVAEVYAFDGAGRQQWYPTSKHFRAAFASYRAASGMNMNTLSTLMGHKMVETTAGYCGQIKGVNAEANEKHRPKTKTSAEYLADNI